MDFRALTAAGIVALWLGGCAVDKREPVGGEAGRAPVPPSVRYDQHVFAGGEAPPGDSLRNPFAGDAKSAREGEQLFVSMNCDGCHGGGATGWVAPNLGDGRWRYGESDGAVFQSIFYGRPKGMPAFGGMLQPAIIWKLVAYIRSLPATKAVPTQAW